MSSNYYEILEVSPTASPMEIKKAYKQAALKHHPDRGGQHAQMVLVNEAYLVLGDPELRAQYDHFLTAGTTEESAWQTQATAAQEAAQHYPKTWSDFEHWSERLTNDFTQARYGKTQVWGPVIFPQIDNSVSGFLFCFLGAILGIALLGFNGGIYSWLWHASQLPIESRPYMYKNGIWFMLLMLLPPFLGSWAGCFLHQILRLVITEISTQISVNARRERAVQNPPPPPTPPPDHQILACPHCQQKLRLPTHQGTLAVTCPQCRHQFDWQS